MAREKNVLRLRPRIRVMVGDTILFGPGKADILGAIEDTGSLREAASRLGMSYMRAWTLVRTMNDGFREPLVTFRRGGRERGGADLTSAGRNALSLYRAMERAALDGMAGPWRKLRKLVRAGVHGDILQER